mgnify:CR=1 FL=1
MLKRTSIKRETILITIVGIVIIVSLVLAWQVWDLRDKNARLQTESTEVERLIKNPPGVLGRSCGVLDKNEAVDILNVEDLELRYSNQAVANEVDKQEGGIHWIDSCRYASASSSNVYVELFIETYQSAQAAEKELQNSLPKVGLRDVASDKFEELYYNSGAWFAREQEVVIKVSASKPTNGGLKNYSQKIFDDIISKL